MVIVVGIVLAVLILVLYLGSRGPAAIMVEADTGPDDPEEAGSSGDNHGKGEDPDGS
jgi:hypothetical protein